MMVLVMRGDQAYHDRNAVINPTQENVKTLPYTLKGFNAGIDLAFLLIGLTSGALNRTSGSMAMVSAG